VIITSARSAETVNIRRGVSTESSCVGPPFLEERVKPVWKRNILAESPVRRTGEAIGFDRTSSNFVKNGPASYTNNPSVYQTVP